VMAIDRTARSAGDAVPDPPDTPELFAVDMDQIAGPLALVAHHHRLCFHAAGLPRPSRRRIAPTVETGMPSWRAIAGPLIRCRRNAVISLIRSAAMRCLQHPGAELRSRNCAAPPLRQRVSQR